MVCGLTTEEYLERITAFHNYPAPGLIIGGFLVDAARRRLPCGTLFEALCETSSCLPDAVQLFTPCTIGNGWLRVLDLGRYAVTLYDKYTGQGFRAWLDPARFAPFPELAAWFLKFTHKSNQDAAKLREEIFAAGESVVTVREVQVAKSLLGKRSKGAIAICPGCGEAYPAANGPVCLGCQGGAPFELSPAPTPKLMAVPLEEAVGRKLLHDMTEIKPGVSKGPAFHRGQTVTPGDLCRLQRMGRMSVYVEEPSGESFQSFVHEEEAASAMADVLCRTDGITSAGPPREGKITLLAARDGLFTVDTERLAALNGLADVALSTRRHGALVKAGQPVSAFRAIPLLLARQTLDAALRLASSSSLLDVRPLHPARAGALITGTEVFTGLVEDRFASILADKLVRLGSTLAETRLVPDDAQAIAEGANALLSAGCDLILTTAGLSVDPGDVTRQGLVAAGLMDALFGLPILPGNMTLTGNIRGVPLLGIPACALFHQTTSLDILLPRILAGLSFTRAEFARMGHGGFCLNCEQCSFPHCPFGS